MQQQDLSPPTVPGPHPRQRIGAARRTADAQDRCRAGDLMVAGGYGSSAVVVRSTAPSSWSNSTFVGAITNDPCNVSVLVVGGLIVPYRPTASTSPRPSPTATGPPQATSLASSPKPGGSMWPPPCSRPPASRMTSRPMSAAPASPSLPSSRKAPPCTRPAMRVYAPSTRSKKCRTTTVTMMALYTGIKKVRAGGCF
ncbi:COPII coat assembly protein sec16-like [Triticum aestivum]|uniref:COPII coat assembly protein sec16-like n=1 Tax=Triticum aestivum TaxID=4565 RepID=UPI001D024B8C|nr:COPII coat assembly protein sec16-like [Triticum aestivum]